MNSIHRGFPKDLWSSWLSQADDVAVMQIWLPDGYYPLADLEELSAHRPRVRVMVSHPDAELAKLRSRDQCVEDIDVQSQIAQSLLRLERSRRLGMRLEVRVVNSEGLIPFQLYALPNQKGLQASFYPHCRASESPQLEIEGELLENACRAFDARWETSAVFIDEVGTVHKSLLDRAETIVKAAQSSQPRSESNPRSTIPRSHSGDTVKRPLSVFMSYARPDARYLRKLDKHLSGLQREGLISTWYDGEILPGCDWNHEILSHLQSAEVILLLVSSDFIASDFCYTEEMMRALERHNQGEAIVVPIILRATDWKRPPLDALQVLPAGAKPVQDWRPIDKGFLSVTEGLRRSLGRFGGRRR